MKKKKPITNSYSNKDKLNTIEKKYSFHSTDNPLNINMNYINNSPNTKEFTSNSVRVPSNYLGELEQSMLELKNYIEIVAPSDTKTIESVANKLTFRPKNLEYHRKLVEENRKLYLESLHKKQMKELEYKKRLEKKMIKMEKLSKIWVNEIIPNWTEKKKDKKIKEYFYMGLPDNVRGKVWMLCNVRGKVWMLCLGNRFSITKEYYEIQVKNSKEIIEKYKANKKNNEIMIDDMNILNNNKESKEMATLTKDKEKSINIIELDIERTFPYLGLFRGDSPMAQDLREILRVFVISRS